MPLPISTSSLPLHIFNADAYLYLRGNRFINYEQLGLKFKLFSAEVLFNRGLSQLYLGYAKGMSDLEQARKEKEVIGHEVIDDVIRDRGGQYTVFSVPVGVLYHPSEKKLRNSKVKDYLGKAKLVIGSDLDDIYTEFSGVTELKQNSDPSTSSPLESTSNADPKASLSGTPDRGATASIFRTRSIGPSPTTERSKTINGVPKTQTGDPDEGADGECGRRRAPRGDFMAPVPIPEPLSTASHLSPIFPHRPRTPGSDAQPQSRQGRAARFTCFFPVPRYRCTISRSLATMCCSIHRSSE